jgi:hypothetical protein
MIPKMSSKTANLKRIFIQMAFEGCAGFVVLQMGVGGFGYKIQGPAGVFTAELSALFTALRHIAEVIQPPEICFILTGSLSSIKALLFRKIAHQTHPLLYE